MAKKNVWIQDYFHDEKRKNNLLIETVSCEPKIKLYAYDLRLLPQLVWAGKPGLAEKIDGAKLDRAKIVTYDSIKL